MYLRWIIWILGVLFYFYEYFLRVAPSVMIPNLMQAFSVNAALIGTMTAFYLYAYAPMQLPVGLLLDRYGARRLLTFAALICAFAGFLFGFANQLWIANISRILMGVGSAFGFVSMIYISSHWFEKSKLSFLIGIGNSIGMMGAVIGQGPLSILEQSIGWRATYFLLGFFGLAISVLVFLVVRNAPPNYKENKKKQIPILKSLYYVIRLPQCWINSCVAFLFYASIAAFAGLWCVPYLHTRYDLPMQWAGFGTSLIYIGYIVGGPIIGHLSDRMSRKKIKLLIGSLLAFICLWFIVYMHLSIPILFILLFFLGFFCATQLLTYSFAIDLTPEESKGTAVAFTNFMVFLGGAILQSLIGYLLVLDWDKEIINGIPVYSTQDYQFALSVFVGTLAMTFLLSLFLRETYGGKTHFRN